MRRTIAFLVPIPILALALLLWYAHQNASTANAITTGNTSIDTTPKEVSVYSAAGAAGAMRAIAAEYEKETGVKIHCNFSSSSVLARQIEQGAPADIFVSAHPRWIEYLESKNGLVPGSRRSLVSNRLVIIAPHGKKQPFTLIDADTFNDPCATANAAVPAGFARFPAAQRFIGNADLNKSKEDLLREMKGKIAVGDPTHVPVGEYAKEILNYYGCYETLSPRFVPAGSVAATVRLVETGETDCGIVYTSSIVGNTKVDTLAAIPAKTHRPIIFSAALCSSATRPSPEVKAFFEFLRGPHAQNIMVEHGFDLISENQNTGN